MSHEIRTAIECSRWTGISARTTTLNEDQRQLLSKIRWRPSSAGRHHNVLDLSKIEAGEMSLEDEPFDLPELVRDLGQMLPRRRWPSGSS